MGNWEIKKLDEGEKEPGSITVDLSDVKLTYEDLGVLETALCGEMFRAAEAGRSDLEGYRRLIHKLQNTVKIII